MATQTRKGCGLLTIALAVILGAAAGVGGAWAHNSGLLAPLYHRLGLHDLAGAVPAAAPGQEDHAGRAAQASSLPGYTVVQITPERQQLIGVRTGRVERDRLRMSLQVVGIVEPDQTRLTRIHTRVSGWVTKVHVNYVGADVQKDDPLLELYSPDLVTTQSEYLNALAAWERMGKAAEQRTLVDLALRRLELFGVPADEIKRLETTRQARDTLQLRSPIQGRVLMRNVQEGSYVEPAADLYQIADLSSVWLQAKVYEYELPHVELHQPVHVALPAQPDMRADGMVEFVEPVLDEATRTAKVRVPLNNAAGLFKPGMYADLVIDHEMSQTPRSVESASVVGLLGPPAGPGPLLAASALAAVRTGLLVPESGLLRTGERDLAFRVLPDNRFEPVEVKLGARFGERYQVLDGLNEGDEVVTSAAFLIDAESRLKSATSAMSGHHHGGDASPTQSEPPTAPKPDGQDHEHHHHGS
jgi:Cu(I)/Ag(I) efflux system membrane fusion protein